MTDGADSTDVGIVDPAEPTSLASMLTAGDHVFNEGDDDVEIDLADAAAEAELQEVFDNIFTDDKLPRLLGTLDRDEVDRTNDITRCIHDMTVELADKDDEKLGRFVVSLVNTVLDLAVTNSEAMGYRAIGLVKGRCCAFKDTERNVAIASTIKARSF